VNNAGVNPRIEGDFTTIAPDAWIKTLSVNTFGPFFMARAAVPHMKRQGWGRVVGVTTSLDTMIRGAPYGPSKAGHEALVATMAGELDGTGVTANVLIPGGAASTNMIPEDRRYSGLINPAVMERPIVWFASEASKDFNGRRVVAQDWDESLPIEQRLEKCSAPAAWPQLGRSVRRS
jgi:3-oxoacyl-[acyl-carrier protein] reductase